MSILKRVCWLGLKIFRHGVVVTSNFSFPIASSWGFLSLNSTSFFSRVRRGEVTSRWIDGDHLQSLIMAFFVIASIFAGSTFTPLDDICPRNTLDFSPIWHFFLFSFYPLLRIFKNNLFKRSLCSARVLLILLYHLGS